MSINYPSLNLGYYRIIAELQQSGQYERNQRTGVKVRSLPGMTLQVELAHCDQIPIPGWRRVHHRLAVAELLWSLMGTTDPSWLQRHTKMWDLWIEDDGTLPTAYGYRWRKEFGRDQLLSGISALIEDPTNRQVNVFAWHPGKDGNGYPDQPKNIPCILGFTVNVIRGRLNMSVYLRSSDVVVGLPYDYMFYAFLMNMISVSVGKPVGVLTLHLANAHFYECHADIVKAILGMESEWKFHGTRFLSAGIESAIKYPNLIMGELDDTLENDYNPRPELVK
mgnify:CR=1 FL=1